MDTPQPSINLVSECLLVTRFVPDLIQTTCIKVPPSYEFGLHRPIIIAASLNDLRKFCKSHFKPAET
jgi:hypothetical protein